MKGFVEVQFNYNFLTVLEEPLGTLALASKFGEDTCLR
jgi:hypothetical protein